MKEARKSLIVLLVSSTAVFGAQYRAAGGSISYVVSVDSKLQNGSFPQFDPSLGPLNSITYSGNVNVGVLPGFEFDEPVSSPGLTHHFFRAYAPLFPAFLRVYHGN